LPVSREELLAAGFDEETIAALQESVAEEPAVVFDKKAAARLRQAMMSPKEQPLEEGEEEEKEEVLTLEAPPDFAVYDEYDEDEDWEDIEGEGDDEKHGRRKKKPKRTILYDEETGETYTVRKRRQGRSYDLWEDYRDH
jgi:hypothetical protein